MIDALFAYSIENWVEIVGAILSFIYLYLSVKQKKGLWIVGFLCSALYLVVFFQSKFYAEVTLQLYYLVVSVYGWIHWTFGAKNDAATQQLPVSRLEKRQILPVSLITFVIFASYFFFLNRFTDSPVPLGDSFTVALCIVATWMLAKKMLENWLLFIVADAFCVGLFLYKGLYPTAILFFVYTIMAVVGYFRWKRTYNAISAN